MNIFDDGAPEVLARALSILVETEKLLVVNNPEGGPLPSREEVRTYALAMIDEVTEWARELSYKPWKLPKPVDPNRVADEFADILAFLGVLAQLTQELGRVNLVTLANQFRVKSQVNINRINLGKVPGYGGPLVTGVKARPVLEVGRYYSLHYRGQAVVGLLEGTSDDGIHSFALEKVDRNGLAHWYLAGSDPNWMAVPNG